MPLHCPHILDTEPEISHLTDRYDLMLDTAGRAKRSPLKERCMQLLRNDGQYISIDDGKLELSSDRLMRLKALIEEGRCRPIVDRIYPIDRIVEAHEYVEQGIKKGGVALTIDHAD